MREGTIIWQTSVGSIQDVAPAIVPNLELGMAGLGIAFHAKPLVKERADNAISTLGLDSILYLMGIRDSDAERKAQT